MNRPFVAATIVIVFLSSFVGCGGGKSVPTGIINGKLTLAGQAPPAGTQIQFISDNGGASAVVSADGSFTIDDAPVGTHVVMVTPPLTGAAASAAADPAAAMKMVSGEGAEGAGSDPTAFEATGGIPIKYTDSATSGETFVVKDGTNDFALDMKE